MTSLALLVFAFSLAIAGIIYLLCDISCHLRKIAESGVHLVTAQCRIAFRLESGELTGPTGHAGKDGAPGKDGAAGKDAVPVAVEHPLAHEALARVMRYHGGKWLESEFVRQGTPAWQKAWDTPGVALMPAKGEMQLGNQ
jgi:hypothetical protein